jgi:hypothetical protein
MRFLVYLLFVTVSYCININDNTLSDWLATEKFSSNNPNVSWLACKTHKLTIVRYFTWDDENFYFGVNLVPDPLNSIVVYVDTDPRPMPLSGRGIGRDGLLNAYPVWLPFTADFAFTLQPDPVIRVADVSESIVILKIQLIFRSINRQWLDHYFRNYQML